jgi:SAM-dependent methyltransferase
MVDHMKFQDHYVESRSVKWRKIQQIFGIDYWKGLNVLELGCGLGDTGRKFESWGANVTYAEGRLEHVEHMQKIMPNAEIIQLDNDEPWDLKRKFDCIIHWGLIYHIKNWKQDLRCVFKHTSLLLLEGEVLDSDDPNLAVLKQENHLHYDQALNGYGAYLTANNIEMEFSRLKVSYKRYDDQDLTVSYNGKDIYRYNWKITNTGEHRPKNRRFWVAQR